jgi:predicted ATPase/DNA-binding SARP family transcriptional activator
MQFRILGPLEVADRGALISLAAAERALLAVLLLSANEVVSSDRLIDELWGEHSPRSGRTALQVRVSQLRKALGAQGSRILTHAPGYMLRVDSEELDVWRFERLIAKADGANAPTAAARLREALALWRGPPLADLAYESFAQPTIARLEELRLTTIEKRIEADLVLGRHAELVGELEALVAEHPLGEHFRAQLMLALYRCGRQADALAVYKSARRDLVEQLGIEPSPSLRELEQAILRQDASLAVAPADPAAFNQLAEASAPVAEPLHNLPARASRFVGRGRELEELIGLLSGARVLTLTGAGGVGKTRLALELADLALSEWSDGVWFVDLAPLSDPTLVAAKLASALGVPEAPGRSPQESLVVALGSRELLLIFDNCEHLIESTAILADSLVTQCPRTAIVATSREPLRIAGEQVYRVPSLSLPPDHNNDPEHLPDAEAIRLFIDRARQQRPDFTLDAHNSTVVARLCRRLDGIPLAIELAAARLRAIAINDIEQRLDQRFALLTGGSRTAPPRQRTLQALIEWSYNLLDPRQQQLLERLSVFAGGFDLESAEAVAGPSPDAPVLDEVVALVDKSLVQFDHTNNRYRLLENVREYTAAKLLARGETDAKAVRTAHRDHYLGMAETAAPHLIGRGQAEWLDRLALELDNLRVAVAESLSDRNPEPGLRLTGALHYFWVYRGQSAEGVHAACAALDRADAQAPTLLRGRALVATAHLLTNITCELDAASGRAREALTIARSLSDERLRADALCQLLHTAVFVGDEGTHARIANESLHAASTVGDPHLTAQVLLDASSSTHVSHTERRRALEEALALSREAGDQALHIRVLGTLGNEALEAGDIGAARPYLQQATRLSRDTGNQSGLTAGTVNLGFASYLDGADAAARAQFGEALRIARRNGDLYGVAHAQLGLALLTARAGDASGAATLHGTADAINEQLGSRFVAVESRLRDLDIAALRTRLGDSEFERAYTAGRKSRAGGEPALA